MAYTTIDDPLQYFNTVLYTGNGSSTHAITGVGFQPDFLWIKSRSAATRHSLQNSVAGITNFLRNGTNAEATGGVKTADSDGFTVDDSGMVNANSETFVSWNWLAGGSASSNGDGDITSSVSAGSTQGFSIVSYTGNGSAGATVGHGLGSKPKVIIVKIRSTTDHWIFYNENSGATKNLRLNSNDALITAGGPFNNTEPTSSLFTLGSGSATNTNSATFIAYCFAEKKGYSKFGSYTGNGNSDGTFVYTGFRPAWVLLKRTDAAENWPLFDNKRRPSNNVGNNFLYADLDNADDSSTDFDMFSNGFKIRTASNLMNGSGASYIYMAFAHSPLVNSKGVPNNAR